MHLNRLTTRLVTAAVAVVVALSLAAGAASQAQAQDIKQLGQFQDWRAFTFQEDGSKVCYIASQPKQAEGDYTKRGDIYAMVTHRPAQGTQNVVSFVIGYPFKADSRVNVSIDGKGFTLFTHKDTAWAPDKETDRALVQAMRAGRNMIVKGVSKRDTETTDTYSLLGFTAAHNTINKACNVN